MKVPFSGSIHAHVQEPRSGVHDGGCNGQHVVGGAMSCGHGIIPWPMLDGVLCETECNLPDRIPPLVSFWCFRLLRRTCPEIVKIADFSYQPTN
jgi:hypothetical protein